MKKSDCFYHKESVLDFPVGDFCDTNLFHGGPEINTLSLFTYEPIQDSSYLNHSLLNTVIIPPSAAM